MPQPEVILWNRIRGKQLGYKFRRQFSIINYIIDFYCPEKHLAIEIDGESHFRPRNIECDNIRDNNLRTIGIKVLRFTNIEIKDNMDGVITAILSELNTPSYSP